MKKISKKVKQRIANGIFYSIIVSFILGVVGLCIYVSKHKIKFDDNDWQYMYDYIEKEFGNGEEFHIISTDTGKYSGECKSKKDQNGGWKTYCETLGIRATIIGYFDSQENIYAIGFAKLSKDSVIYKDGKVGTIICTTVVNTQSKDEYLKDNDK